MSAEVVRGLLNPSVPTSEIEQAGIGKPDMPPRNTSDKDYSFDHVCGLISDQTRVIESLSRSIQATNGTKDKTALPNWLMPIILTVLCGLLVFVWQTDRNQTDKRLETQETENRVLRNYITHCTEEMIRHGINPGPIPEPTGTKH